MAKRSNTVGSQDSLVRRLPLIVGILGGGLLVINRLTFTPELLNSQSRSDALGILLSALLILTGLLWQQIQPPLPESVELEGDQCLILHPDLSEAQIIDLGWISRTLLTATAARSIVIWFQDRVVLQRGIFPTQTDPLQLEPGAILQRVLHTGRLVYLVDLKLFPAKAEFTRFLPSNTQAVLCQPIGHQGVLILGTDTPRSFTPPDQRWIEALAERIEYLLTSEQSEKQNSN